MVELALNPLAFQALALNLCIVIGALLYAYSARPPPPPQMSVEDGNIKFHFSVPGIQRKARILHINIFSTEWKNYISSL